MKQFIIIIVVLISLQTFSQTPVPVLDLGSHQGNPQNGAYYQDTNFLLNPFVGTYILNENGVYFKIVFQKAIMAFNSKYYEDTIYGEYQYSDQNGNQINTLDVLNQNLQYIWQHNIDGNGIITNNVAPRCDECLPNEIRLRVGLFDPVTGYASSVFIRRIMVYNQEAIQIFISGQSTGRLEGAPPGPIPTVPHGLYTLIKQ